MRGAGLVAALVMSGVLWIYGHGGSGGTANGAGPAYCRDVGRVEAVMADARQNGTSRVETRLGSLESALQSDAISAGSRTRAGTALNALALDTEQWREALVAGDAVNETIALDRVLSVVTAVPGC